jgi:hypothetical protein
MYFPEEEFLPSYVTDRLTVPKALGNRIAREYRLMRQHNQVLKASVLPNQVLLTTISFVKCKYPLLPKTLLFIKATAMRGVWITARKELQQYKEIGGWKKPYEK